MKITSNLHGLSFRGHGTPKSHDQTWCENPKNDVYFLLRPLQIYTGGKSSHKEEPKTHFLGRAFYVIRFASYQVLGGFGSWRLSWACFFFHLIGVSNPMRGVKLPTRGLKIVFQYFCVHVNFHNLRCKMAQRSSSKIGMKNICFQTLKLQKSKNACKVLCDLSLMLVYTIKYACILGSFYS